MLTKKEIQNRIQNLSKGETELFKGSEVGQPGGGIFVTRSKYQADYPVYEITQYGDWCGKHNLFGATDFVAKEANI